MQGRPSPRQWFDHGYVGKTTAYVAHCKTCAWVCLAGSVQEAEGSLYAHGEAAHAR